MQKIMEVMYFTKESLAIIEPLKEGDMIYLVRDGHIYEWDNTVTETTYEDLKHFKEVGLKLVEIEELPIQLRVNNFMSENKERLIEIAASSKLESELESKFLIARFVLDNLYNLDLFKKDIWTKVTEDEDLKSLIDWLYQVSPEHMRLLLNDNYKDITNVETLKKLTEAWLLVNLQQDEINKRVEILLAIRNACESIELPRNDLWKNLFKDIFEANSRVVASCSAINSCINSKEKY